MYRVRGWTRTDTPSKALSNLDGNIIINVPSISHLWNVFFMSLRKIVDETTYIFSSAVADILWSCADGVKLADNNELAAASIHSVLYLTERLYSANNGIYFATCCRR